jgi:hypothetical protein
MSDRNIVPEKITKPIQLLAAWLAGLILVNGSFLGAASAIASPEWARAALIVASIINVPLFLSCLFLLQTKFRPEMQEDSYYAKYLEQNTGKVVSTSPIDTAMNHLRVELAESSERYIKLISGLDAGLKELAFQVARQTEGSSRLGTVDAVEVIREVRESSKAIERAMERASDAKLTVLMNDLLPEADLIRKNLWLQRIAIDRTFGKSSKDPEVPRMRIVGFGKGVLIEQLRKIVRVCLPFGFDHIHFAHRDENANTVYIGSYIYRAPKEPQPVKLTQDILELIEADTTDIYEVIGTIESARA